METKEKDMYIYISGAISDPNPEVRKDNLRKFNVVADRLRAEGYEVFNPGDLEQKNWSWLRYMIRDVWFILTHKVRFVFLPNWLGSRGANIEHLLAVWKKVPRDYE